MNIKEKTELFKNVQLYIDKHLVLSAPDVMKCYEVSEFCQMRKFKSLAESDIDNLNKEIENIDASFIDTIGEIIRKKDLKEPDVYKRAGFDRRFFSKMMNTPSYHPKKNTALSFAIGLQLNINETKSLLAKAGYSLSPSSATDIAVKYFIQHKIYDIILINEFLYSHDLSLLGSQDK